MQHLDEGTIHAWLDGALTADEAARVELHVASCETCADAVAEARGFIAASSRILTALDDVPRLSGARWGQRDRGDRRPFLVRWRIAAVVALVVGGGALALAVRPRSAAFVALEAKADRESTATIVAIDSPVANAPEFTAPSNVDGTARVHAERPPGRGAVGAAAGRTPAQEPAPERDLAGFAAADSAPVNLAQLEVRAAAAPPPTAPARTDDVARVPSAVAAEARVTADTARVANRSSVTEKLAGALGASRSVADASARFAEPAAPQAGPPAALEPNAPRLLTEERITEADGRLVVRRVYRVEETLVTLDERAPQEREQREQVVPEERLQRLEERLRRMEERQAPAVPTATIRWVDARGAEFTLSGAAPQAQLERFRKLLGY